VVLTNERLRTAATLSQYIYWRGRYVVPTERGIDDLIPVVLDNGLLGQPHNDVTIEVVRDLIHYVIGEVKARLYVNGPEIGNKKVRDMGNSFITTPAPR